jgi:hypothetical protein
MRTGWFEPVSVCTNIILSSIESYNNGTYMDDDIVGVSYCCKLLTN